MYEIQSKSDLHTGAELIVRIPENDIDKKAFYTILAEQPDFILPFKHRAIDGQIEFTYQIGNRSKLAYLYGNRTPFEYANLWMGVLQPLIDCGDWFMNPYSFVLNPDFLYCEKDSYAVSYVYIPSTRVYSSYDALKSMVIEIAKQNHVSDVKLENEVVWAIQDFSPYKFLQILKPYSVSKQTAAAREYARIQTPAQASAPASAAAPDAQAHAPIQPENNRQTPNRPEIKQPVENKPKISFPKPLVQKRSEVRDNPADAQKMSDDIVINISPKATAANEKAVKEKVVKEKPVKEKASKEKVVKEKAVKEKSVSEKEPKGIFLSFGKKEKAEKIDKPPREPKARGGLFGKKKEAPQEIMQGAAAAAPGQPIQTFDPQPASSGTPSMDTRDDVTQLELMETEGPKFRYTGSGEHPKTIDVQIGQGGIFTIGRFDASVGTQQSSFEFDKKTKAVSRRHAAVERDANGYIIVDLDSSAGTFIDGKKLPSNTPMVLTNGCRVSFGHSGADYIWEE